MSRTFYLLILFMAFIAACNTVEPRGNVPVDITDSANSVEDSARGIIDRANEHFHTNGQVPPDSSRDK